MKLVHVLLLGLFAHTWAYKIERKEDWAKSDNHTNNENNELPAKHKNKKGHKKDGRGDLTKIKNHTNYENIELPADVLNSFFNVTSAVSSLMEELNSTTIYNGTGMPQASDVPSTFHSIMSVFSNIFGGSCVGFEPDYTQVHLLLFTNDPTSYVKLNPEAPTGIDNNATLYILAHGWLSGLNGYLIRPFRDKYIELYGKNILFVDYGALAFYPYPTVACNIPFIGTHIAQFLCRLHETQGFDLSNVHMVGHSLGGQLAGLTGKGVKTLCGKTMGRITALDPAGPMFDMYREQNRLIPTDAEYVEVLHSNSGLFGYLGKAGTVDYHLNCGSTQPGCIIPEKWSKVAQNTFMMLTCAHMRSVEIWPYILESKKFIAKSCEMCSASMPDTCRTDRFGANYFTLARGRLRAPSTNYNLATGPYPPFNLGCNGYHDGSCT